MSRLDEMLSYVILLIASLLLIVLVVIYGPQPARFSEDLIRTGTPPFAVRTTSPMAREGVMAAQSLRSDSHQAQSALTRTIKVGRQAPAAQGASGLGSTRSAATKPAQGAKAPVQEGESAAATANGTRSAEIRTAQAANPAADTPTQLTRSASDTGSRAAVPSAGTGTDAGLTRTASMQMANAARSQEERRPAQDLSRSVVTAADRAAAQPTASQAFDRILVRSAPEAAERGARAGDQNPGFAVKRTPAQASQTSAAKAAKSPERSAATPNRSARAPMSAQRKWDPARSSEASSEEEPKEL